MQLHPLSKNSCLSILKELLDYSLGHRRRVFLGQHTLKYRCACLVAAVSWPVYQHRLDRNSKSLAQSSISFNNKVKSFNIANSIKVMQSCDMITKRSVCPSAKQKFKMRLPVQILQISPAELGCYKDDATNYFKMMPAYNYYTHQTANMFKIHIF